MKMVSKVKKLTALVLTAGILGGLGPFWGVNPKAGVDAGLAKNVFAMKAELKCSWDDSSGEALNQKLNFGTYPTGEGKYKSGEPLQWWICDTDTDTAYLYAATPVPYSSEAGGYKKWRTREYVTANPATYTGDGATPINDEEWALSDVRAYLNPGLTSGTLSNGEQNCSNEDGAYPAAEYGDFSTNYLPNNGERALLTLETVKTPRCPDIWYSYDYTYSNAPANQIVTKDFFWLPTVLRTPESNNDFCPGLGHLHYAGAAGENDVIPCPYQTGGDVLVDISGWGMGSAWPKATSFSWLRSPFPILSYGALVAASAGGVRNDSVSGIYIGAALAPACKINLTAANFASAARSAAKNDTGFIDISGSVSTSDTDPLGNRTPGMFLRFTKDNPINAPAEPTFETTDGKTTAIGGENGQIITIQGVTEDGKNWSYSRELDGNNDEVTLAEITTAAYNQSSIIFDSCLNPVKCRVWAEVEEDGLIYASDFADIELVNNSSNSGNNLSNHGDDLSNTDDNSSNAGNNLSETGGEVHSSVDDTVLAHVISPTTGVTVSPANSSVAPSGSPYTTDVASDEQNSSDGDLPDSGSPPDDLTASAPPLENETQNLNWFANNWPWLMAAAVLATGAGSLAYIKFRKKAGGSEA